LLEVVEEGAMRHPAILLPAAESSAYHDPAFERGTSHSAAMDEHLHHHPEIFMPERKELYFLVMIFICVHDPLCLHHKMGITGLQDVDEIKKI
jgi:hypothetical protein